MTTAVTTSDSRPITPERVLAIAIVAAVALAAVDGFAPDPAGPVRTFTGVTVYLLASVGTWLAARAFADDDHLRRAWVLFSLSNLLLAFGRLVLAHRVPGLPAGPAEGAALASATVVSNLLGVAAMVTFAVTWHRTGLPTPGTPRQRVAVAALLSTATVVAVGPDLWRMIREAAGGDLVASSLAFADLCDTAVFLLSVPVFLAARAFAGGSLGWPFGLLAASNLTWLLVDGFATYGLLGGTNLQTVVGGLLRNLSCLLLAAAGVTQRLALPHSASGVGDGSAG